MASKRKAYRAKTKTRTPQELFGAFMRDLLSGVIAATKLLVTGTPHKPDLSYDDPNG